MIKNTFNVLKIICIVIFLLGSNVCARTEYKALEKSVNLKIFSEYVDYLEQSSNYFAFRKINTEDKNWLAVVSKHHNTISNVYYSKQGYVVIENQKYNFQFHFKPQITEKSIIWTCDFIDNSVFFSFTCLGWKKSLNTQ